MEDWEPRKLIEKSPDRFKAATLLIFHHGLRIGETLALTLDDVKITPAEGDTAARAEVSITKNYQYLKDEKTGKMSNVLMDTPKTEAGNRVVDIFAEDVPKLIECVERRKTEGAKSTDLLTEAARGGAVTPNSYRSELEEIKVAAKVSSKIHPHCGRYWLITRLSEMGVTIKAIGEIMGQTDLKTITEIYMRVSPGATSEAMLNLGAVLHEQAKAEKKKKEEAKAKEGGRQ